MAWWYGPIKKNVRESSVPLAIVLFHPLDEDGTLNTEEWIRVEVALSFLGLMPIGSVWRGGTREAIAVFQEETFESLDFSEEGWSFTSFSEALRQGRPSPFPLEGYPLMWGRRDQNFLIDFHLPDGRNLIVPCLEFFTRCYGRSAEVRRVLATYPWEDGKSRLLKPIEDDVEPGTWPVRLARRAHNGDAVFLAHVRYSGYARSVAASLYHQANAVFAAGGPGTTHVFLKVAPWFRGPAKLKASGLWLAGGKTFLALHVLGVSDPQGEQVIRERESVSGAGADEAGVPDTQGANRFARHPLHPPEIIDLTSDEEPDHGAQPIDIEDDGLEVLGEPRRVIDRKIAVERGLAGRRFGDGGHIRAVSAGEPYGGGRGVGYGAIHAPTAPTRAQMALESHGVLRDMWNAAHKLQERFPYILRTVSWFTFDAGISRNPEPKLIALKPYSHEDAGVDTSVRNWIYYDPDTQTPRGVLVMLIRAQGKLVCLVEIQRRIMPNTGEQAQVEFGEESLKGLVFALESAEDPGQHVRRLIAEIRRKRGIVSQVVERLAWSRPVFAFKHVPAKDELFPCEAAVRNALRKVGIVLPGSPDREPPAHSKT